MTHDVPEVEPRANPKFPRRRRFLFFSLRTLLLATVLLGFIWTVQHRMKTVRLNLSAGFTHNAWRAAVSPDGRWIGSAGGGKAALWSADTGAVKHEIAAHTAIIRYCGFSPDGRWFTTSADDGSAALWDVATGALKVRLIGHISEIYYVIVSPDGRLAFTAYDYGVVQLWDVGTGASLVSYSINVSRVAPLAFSPDSKFVVFPSSNNTIPVLDTQTLAVSKSLVTGPAGVSFPVAGVFFASFSPDGRCIVTLNLDGDGSIWDASTGAKVTDLKGEFSSYCGASFSSDGSRIALVGEGSKSALMIPGPAHVKPSAARCTPTGVWDTSTGEMLVILEGANPDCYRCPQFSPDGEHLSYITRPYAGGIWSARDGKKLRNLEQTCGLTFTPDGKELVRVRARGGMPVDVHPVNAVAKFYTLPEFWAALVCALGLLISLWVDRRDLRGKAHSNAAPSRTAPSQKDG